MVSAKIKLKILYYVRLLLKSVFLLIQLGLIVGILWQVGNKILDYREEQHSPVSMNDISYTIDNIPLYQYNVSINESNTYKLNNLKMYQVKIGDYKVYVDEATYHNYVGDNTSIESTLSILNIHCDYIFAEDIHFLHVDKLGQAAYSDDSIQSYLDYAMSYYTYEKYAIWLYKDAQNYIVKEPSDLVK